jgi:hypothetical protein
MAAARNSFALSSLYQQRFREKVACQPSRNGRAKLPLCHSKPAGVAMPAIVGETTSRRSLFQSQAEQQLRPTV